MATPVPQPELLLIATTDAAVRARMPAAESRLAGLPNAVPHAGEVPGRLHLTTAWTEPAGFFAGMGVFGSTLFRPPQLPPADVEGRGCYMLMRARDGGRLEIRSDPLGMFPVFLYDRDGTVAVSSSALLLEAGLAAVGIPLRRSNAFFGYVVTLGSGYDGITGFEAVRTLAAGETLLIDGENRCTRKTTHVGHFLYSNDRFENLLDQAVDEVQSNVRAISALPVEERICDLSGGMDSRLVLAAILHEGLAADFHFLTKGFYPNADANAGALIRETFGLANAAALELAAPPPVRIEPIDQLRMTIGKLSGLLDMYIGTKLQEDDRRAINLGGGLGEIMRRFWSSSWSLLKPGVTPLHKVVASMQGRSALIRPEVFRQQVDTVAGKGFQYLREHVDPAHIGDAFYLTARCPYHFGVPWSRSQSRFHPLYSIAALRAAHAISPEERNANRVGYEMMRRMSPQLAAMPFAGKKWNPRLMPDAPEPITPDSPRYGDWARVPPKPVRPPAPKPRPAGAPAAPKAPARPSSVVLPKGAHRYHLKLPQIMESFAQAFPDPDYSVLGDVFDVDAVSKFMREARGGVSESQDAWTAYRVLIAYLWATHQEIWSMGIGLDDVRGALR